MHFDTFLVYFDTFLVFDFAQDALKVCNLNSCFGDFARKYTAYGREIDKHMPSGTEISRLTEGGVG